MFFYKEKASHGGPTLTKRGLTLYFALLERFVAAGVPTTFRLSLTELSGLTGLEVWEVIAARIELLVAGCLKPIHFSKSRTKNAYCFISCGPEMLNLFETSSKPETNSSGELLPVVPSTGEAV